MKKLNQLFAIFIPLLIFICTFSACKKGENLPGKAYGQIIVSSTFSVPTAGPLLVLVDGVVKDTLTFEKQQLTRPITVESGDRKYKLVKLSDKSVLYESILKIETGRKVLPPFFYDGTTALFDDLTAKPTKDSLLIRFINLLPSPLPEKIDLSISLTDDDTGMRYFIKIVKGVGQKDFSSFVQLPNPLTITPNQSRFSVDIYDSVTGENTAVDKFFDFQGPNGTRNFIPNAVSSFTVRSNIIRGRPVITISPVFQRIAE